MLKFFKRLFDARLTRELWVKVFVESMNQGNDKDYSKGAADNAVVAYNSKFVKIKINLNN